MKLGQLILVIENDHETRVFLRAELEKEGHTVISATNSYEAFSLLPIIGQPACIFLSNDSPVTDPEHFWREKSRLDYLLDVPVVQISHDAAPILPGAFCRVPKPLEKETLLKAVAQTSKQAKNGK